MVAALFTLTQRLERARHQIKAASALDLLQVIAGEGGMRLTDIAAVRHVHPSLITRQVQELEAAGYVTVTQAPRDRRSWLAALTPSGAAEMLRLQEIGLDRFAQFVADWESADVQALADLLHRLQSSMVTVDRREKGGGAADAPRPASRHGRRRGRPEEMEHR